MKRIGYIASLLLLFSCSGPDITLLVGTYTEGTASHGVYLYSLNTGTGKASMLSEAASWNPSFVIPVPGSMYAYGVNEFNDGRQGVSSYIVFGDSVKLESTVPIPAGGEDPCNILYTGWAIVTSNYTGGTLSAFSLNEDGEVGPLTQMWSPLMSSVYPFEGPAHLHCAMLSPDGRYIFAADLGNDCIHRFELRNGSAPLGTATLAWRNTDEVKYGPRHLTFSADGRFAYLICELGDKLVCFSYDDGALTPIQILDAYSGAGNGSADIHLTPDGRFLYTSHRLKEDGIAIFSVDAETGRVTPVGYQHTGIHPRNFAITPDGRHLLCACRDSNCIEVYAINRRTGHLTKLSEISIPAPVCVHVLDRI
ncbi:MAG: lactonase family protein [Bacteroidales bacterium]|nr:lactonase family protein [Bacteroidales bacterium]